MQMGYTIAHIGKGEQLYGQASSAGGRNDEPVRRQAGGTRSPLYSVHPIMFPQCMRLR